MDPPASTHGSVNAHKPEISRAPATPAPPSDPRRATSTNTTTQSSSSSSSAGTLPLRDYAGSIAPSTAPRSGDPTSGHSAPPVSTARNPELARDDVGASLPSSPFLPLRPAVLASHHRNALSSDSIPRQTIMKALASRPSAGQQNTPQTTQTTQNNNSTMPLAASLGLQSPNTSSNSPDEPDRSCTNPSSQKLSAALSSLQLGTYLDRMPSTARLVMQSPCFFHQRFDDAVNIQKVLEEIADDEWLSHSRLVQTATGVREVSKQLQRRPIKRAVKNVMIVTKARDNSLVHLTRELAEWLLMTPRYGSDLGVNVYVDAKLRRSKRFNAPELVAKNPRFEEMLNYWTPDLCWTSPEMFDLVLTLGGDGTVLFTSWLFQRVVPPILCFSLGSLGFLTNFEFDHYKDHLNAVMGDVGMRVNLRMRFTCTVFRKDRSKGADADAVEEGEQFEVLNELVMDRGPSPYVSNLELYADNDLLTVVQADGCIFSTPTGMSTLSFYFYLTNETRIYRLLPICRRVINSSFHPRHSPHPHLPAHTLFPSHGPLGFPPPSHCRPSRLPLDRILLLRWKGPRGTASRRLCHRRSQPVSVPHRRVRQR